MKILRLILPALLLASALSQAASPAPNVVVILTDDMGFGDLSINGSKVIATPNIDSLAREGVNFTSFYASANLCSPSRAGLLTGRYPIRSGMAWGVVEANSTTGLPLEELTVAELLSDAGYDTAMIGKWHLGNRLPYWPTQQGFDYFFGVQHSNDMPDFALFRNETRIEQPVDQAELTQRYTREAVDFIQAERDKPFLLYVAHTFPHIPLFVSDDVMGKSNAGLYGDVIEELDWSTGEIIKALKAAGSFDNTIVIFTSDNGAWFEGSGQSSRGMKGQTWDGAYRVPFVVSWPARIEAGRTISAAAMNIDILPTLAAAAGVAIPDEVVLDGKNLLPLMTGPRRSSPHDYLYYFADEEIVAIRSGRWKLVTHAYHRTSLGALENVEALNGFDGPYLLLFDMLGPTEEQFSLARDNPKLTERLHTELLAARQRFDGLRTRPPMAVYPVLEPVPAER